MYMGFYGVAPWGSEKFYEAVFIGVIMTATSVSITVQSLKELGKLKGKVGTTIMSAAIIDDVIGIIVLTFVIGFKIRFQSRKCSNFYSSVLPVCNWCRICIVQGIPVSG